MIDNYLIINYFHIQIIFVALLFMHRMPRREHFWLRLTLCGIPYLLLPFLIPGGFFNPFLKIGSYFTAGFMIMLILCFLLLLFCFDLTPMEVLFYICISHTIQHGFYCLQNIIECIAPIPHLYSQILLFIMFSIGTILFYLLFGRKIKSPQDIDINGQRVVLFAAISTIIIYVLSYWITASGRANIGTYLFDLLCCILLLIIMFDLLESHRIKRQNTIMLHLLHQEQEQHSLSKANAEIINRKCHDLKHQISALRNMSENEQEQSIRSLENSILIYDSFAKTGNRDVDILLAEKALQGESSGISFRYMVDGPSLSFLETEDMYSLLGNLLDNAMEAVEKVEKERRIITLQVFSRANCLSVHVENECAVQPVFKDGLPLSTKSDKNYHGFGMLSIQYIVKKYGGTLAVNCADGTFTTNILFPLTQL